jgi:low affinity Fe/Cu permease
MAARKSKAPAAALKEHRSNSWFAHFANKGSMVAGRPATFAIAVSVVLVWAISGPLFDYSDTWQLVINTSTTIVTFLMVFLIQNTQNRDSGAIQIKLDELIHALRSTNNELLDLENLDEDSLEEIRQRYIALAEKARKKKKTSDKPAQKSD